MDEALSRLIPTQRIGNDGFSWWIGQIERSAGEEPNNKGGYRYRVRIVGDHPGSKEILPTMDLPWASVMMPVTAPFMPGNIAGAGSQLIEGCWVVGFYIDNDKQKPIIMGSIGQTPGATKIFYTPGPNRPAFITGANAKFQPDPSKDGVEQADEPSTTEEPGTSEVGARTGSGLPTGRTRPKEEGSDEKVPDVPVPPALIERVNREEWCQMTAEKCKDPDLSQQMTHILGQLLYDIQNSGGNIGSFYVNKVSGGLNSVVSTAREKINKANRVVAEFLAKVKGYIKKLIQEAVQWLVQSLLRPDESGNALTPVTEFFNNALKDLGCKMADLGERLEAWLTNVLMSFLTDIYRAAICQVDEFVNGIISKINQLLEEVLGSILGPLQDILGAIAAPLNIIGSAVNFVLKLLGISCSGPDQTCNKYKRVCTDGSKDKPKDKDEKDFLDDLLEGIDNLFGDTPGDYTSYACEEAYTGNPLSETTIGFTGGVPSTSDDLAESKRKIIYNIEDIEVQRGKVAKFVVTRSGYVDSASSVSYQTLEKGTATSEEDYLPVNSILGFTPGETSKEVEVQTLGDPTATTDTEDFYLSLKINSPTEGSDITSLFTRNVAKCDIVPVDVTEPYDPILGKPINPITGIPPVFDDETFPPDQDGDGETDDDDDDTSLAPGSDPTQQTFIVTANRSVCPEGEFIVYTTRTTNVGNGTILYYALNGTGITGDDIVGGSLTGSFVINDSIGTVTVGIEEDDVVEQPETLTFSLINQAASVDVLLIEASDSLIGDFDEGVGNTPETTVPEFQLPSINIDNVITDENGGIIDIPIDKPGDPWAEPPFVFISGEGHGATATGLLDRDGYLTEIRVLSPGFGYKKNLADNNGKRCIIDTFTAVKPGVGYITKPEIFINDEPGLAEAIVNDDGFVIGARILDKTKVFSGFPDVKVIGGGGFGARLLPSLVCLDTDGLSKIGSTKIGTGRYVDCP